MLRFAADLTLHMLLEFWKYQSNLSIDHWKTAKKVMRYLQGTKDYMLFIYSFIFVS